MRLSAAAGALDLHRETFVRRKDQFAQHFYDVFESIPETHLILEYEGRPGFLKKAWAAWFEFFFRTRLDDTLLAYLWRIGVRHVEVNLDQRFSNLGFSVIRQFCYDIVLSEIPRDQAASLMNIIGKMLDLCLLIETEAYITHTTRCDLEVPRLLRFSSLSGTSLPYRLKKIAQWTPLVRTEKMAERIPRHLDGSSCADIYDTRLHHVDKVCERGRENGNLRGTAPGLTISRGANE